MGHLLQTYTWPHPKSPSRCIKQVVCAASTAVFNKEQSISKARKTLAKHSAASMATEHHDILENETGGYIH
jgi:hypothetical protein